MTLLSSLLLLGSEKWAYRLLTVAKSHVSWSYGCRGNHDINADIVMHENSNSRGPVARRPELREVMGQTAKVL